MVMGESSNRNDRNIIGTLSSIVNASVKHYRKMQDKRAKGGRRSRLGLARDRKEQKKLSNIPTDPKCFINQVQSYFDDDKPTIRVIVNAARQVARSGKLVAPRTVANRISDQRERSEQVHAIHTPMGGSNKK
jgi:hypothetical protein